MRGILDILRTWKNVLGSPETPDVEHFTFRAGISFVEIHLATITPGVDVIYYADGIKKVDHYDGTSVSANILHDKGTLVRVEADAYALVLSGMIITELDVRNLKNLSSLSCIMNEIQELDFSGMDKLKTVSCQDNPIQENEAAVIKLGNSLPAHDDDTYVLRIGGAYVSTLSTIAEPKGWTIISV